MQRHTPEEVKKYYNEMTPSYLDIYGDVIQAFRPADTEKLLDYVGRNAGINWGMKVLDLGCGVGGPATYFAKKWNVNLDGVTVSDVQMKVAINKIIDQKLEEKVIIYIGDYHQLEKLPIKNDYYDVVLFLESLGHSDNIPLAIQQAASKLKKGGNLYIKDFYKKHTNNSTSQKIIDKVIMNINSYYFYNTLDLNDVELALKNAGLEIVMQKKIDFIDDVTIRSAFEQVNKIDVFEGHDIDPADWIEIRAVKV